MKNIILLLFLSFLIGSINAQSRKLHFGLQGQLTLRNNSFLAGYNPDRLNLQSRNKSAFGYGVFFSYDLTRSVGLRLAPYLVREKEFFQWTTYDPDFPMITYTHTKEQDYLFANVPLHVLAKLGNAKQFYFFTGGTYFSAIDTETKEPVITLANFDITADIGMGHEIKVWKLGVIPEFKYGFALMDAERSESTGMRYHRNRIMFTLYLSY